MSGLFNTIFAITLSGCAGETKNPNESVDTAEADTAEADANGFGPVEACGEDLDEVCGVVVPDVGSLPSGDGSGMNPSELGPFSVSEDPQTLSLSGGDVPITVFLPEGADESMPLVIALPGYGASYVDYSHMTSHLASHGFVVVGADVAEGGFGDPALHDEKVAKVLEVLDWALSDDNLSQHLDTSKVAMIGHSLGGKLSFYAAALDDRIDVVVGWDPQNSGGPPCFLGETDQGSCNDYPIAPNCEADDPGIVHQLKAESLVFGAEDGLLTPDTHLWAEQFYRGSPSPAHFVSMPDVGHSAWIQDDTVSHLTRGVHTALLLTRLRGYSGLENWLVDGSELAQSSDVTAVHSK